MRAHCAKCGACLSVCPVYRQTLLERLAPRGKHALLKDGEADFSWKSVQDTVSACLQCGACGAKCSAGIEVNEEILSARAVNREFAPSFPILWKIFGSDTAWNGAEKMIRSVPASSGIIYRLASLALSKGPGHSATLPPPAPVPLLSKQGRKRIAAASSLARQHENRYTGMRIALFSGCVQNFIYPGIPEAMVRWFPGARIIMPENQGCCGLPAFSAGAVDAAKKLIERNIRAFAEIDADIILTGCASCSYMIRKWNEISDDSRIPAFIRKTREFTEVADPALIASTASLGDRPVAFHAPCHSRFAPQGVAASEKFIKEITARRYREIEQGCCGHGGSFSLKFPEISEGIFRERLSALEKCGARTVITTCSGCLLQWRMNVTPNDQGSSIDVLHPAELIS